jgi:hypothetical protein
MSRRTSLLLFPLGLALFAAACDGTDRGLLRVQMDDDSGVAVLASIGAASGSELPRDSVSSVDVHVTRIEVKGEDVSEAAAEQDDDSEADATRGGWIVVARPDSVIDLLALSGAPIPVGEELIPQGTYKGFRIVIDASRSSVTMKDGTVLQAVCNSSGGTADGRVHFPSACTSGIKVRVNPFQVTDETTTLTIEFDPSSNFRMIGTSVERDGLKFTPSIDARVGRD